eukprot:CAMPEP_0118720830 /NCGR_PEP_ID=MMETSP0800-20121206/30342_1 /TAXON_ID=210618 ORGANISM="Striatella unipunctata, Strain CCMP2910" /NCGR_SAMPLE_ID=MMETSP0800 /ASSEMBLY_ACC=CAM_ASM_000638 /LENGTH=128 /DNA_ID=CAMNT_0006628541 /DNA_START=170 /DNA_END=553 /DNA_ORIENTATION=-
MMNTYAKHGEATKVEELLWRFESQNKTSIWLYDCAISACAKSVSALTKQGNAQKAEEILQHMLLRQNIKMKIPASLYNHVLWAWTNLGGGLGDVEREEAILQLMEETRNPSPKKLIHQQDGYSVFAHW